MKRRTIRCTEAPSTRGHPLFARCLQTPGYWFYVHSLGRSNKGWPAICYEESRATLLKEPLQGSGVI
jgi:hypothetical protein